MGGGEGRRLRPRRGAGGPGGAGRRRRGAGVALVEEAATSGGPASTRRSSCWRSRRRTSSARSRGGTYGPSCTRRRPSPGSPPPPARLVGCRVHLKVDTGMHRVGAAPVDALALARRIAAIAVTRARGGHDPPRRGRRARRPVHRRSSWTPSTRCSPRYAPTGSTRRSSTPPTRPAPSPTRAPGTPSCAPGSPSTASSPGPALADRCTRAEARP